MSNKLKIVVVVVVIVLAILVWAPWLTTIGVERTISERFNAEQKGIIDGCGLKEIKDTHRTMFGFGSSIRYACGLTLNPEGTWHSVYVSPFSTVHGDFLQN